MASSQSAGRYKRAAQAGHIDRPVKGEEWRNGIPGREILVMGKDVKAALAKLAEFDYAALKKRWPEIYGTQAPNGMSHHLLRHAIAYRLQEMAYGGLRPATRRYLAKILDDDKPTIRPAVAVRPGTRLLREWHGITYEVIVLDRGVIFKGQRYRSLSEVARRITGAKWSGPAFFRLRKKVNG